MVINIAESGGCSYQCWPRVQEILGSILCVEYVPVIPALRGRQEDMVKAILGHTS